MGWNSVGDGEQRASNSRGQHRREKTRFIMISAANAVAVHKAGGPQVVGHSWFAFRYRLLFTCGVVNRSLECVNIEHSWRETHDL